MEIKSLPQDVRDYLRSGENISSVSQCVMELVLNSLDAKATAIAVRINLLTLRIQVVDNGQGITRSNMNLMGTQYMTSKCHTLSDLRHTKHFGFRGEALASICKMAKRVDIVSRLVGEDTTYGKTYENGTTITVTEFMYNFPVRQKRIHKHLDLEETKQRLEQLAIIYYNITFSLRNDASGKIMFQSKLADNVARALVNFHSYISAKNLVQIKVSKNKVAVTGLIYKSSSANSKLQLLYLNKRPISNKRIQKLINTSLTKIAAKGEHPVYCLNIRCPYSVVDLTMSPSKTTVEFKNWDIVSKCIEKAVKSVLESENLVPPVHEKKVHGEKAPSFKSQFGVSQIQGAVLGPKVARNFVCKELDVVPQSSFLSNSKKSRDSEVNIQSPSISRQGRIHSIPSHTINLENQEKGKELIMDKFLKSTVDHPTKKPRTIIEQNKKNNLANTTVTMTVISRKTILKSSRGNNSKSKDHRMISKCVQTTMVQQHKAIIGTEDFSPRTTVSKYFDKSKKGKNLFCNPNTIVHFGSFGKNLPRFGRAEYFFTPVSQFSLQLQNPFPLYRPLGNTPFLNNFNRPLVYSPYFTHTRPFLNRQRGNEVSTYFKTPIVEHTFQRQRNRTNKGFSYMFSFNPFQQRETRGHSIEYHRPTKHNFNIPNFLIQDSKPNGRNLFVPNFKAQRPKAQLKTKDIKRSSILHGEKKKKVKKAINVPGIQGFAYQHPISFMDQEGFNNNFNPCTTNFFNNNSGRENNAVVSNKVIHTFGNPHLTKFLDDTTNARENNAFSNCGHPSLNNCFNQERVHEIIPFNKDTIKFGGPQYQTNFFDQDIKTREADKLNLSEEMHYFGHPSSINFLEQNINATDNVLNNVGRSSLIRSIDQNINVQENGIPTLSEEIKFKPPFNFLDQNINASVINPAKALLQPTIFFDRNVNVHESDEMGFGEKVSSVERPQATNFFETRDHDVVAFNQICKPTNFYASDTDRFQLNFISQEIVGQKSPFFAPDLIPRKKRKTNCSRENHHQRTFANWNFTKQSLYSLFQTKSPEVEKGRMRYVEESPALNSPDVFAPRTNRNPSIEFQSTLSETRKAPFIEPTQKSRHFLQNNNPLFPEHTRFTDQSLLLNDQLPLTRLSGFISNKSAENGLKNKNDQAFFEKNTAGHPQLDVPTFFLSEKDYQVFGPEIDKNKERKVQPESHQPMLATTAIKKHKSDPLAPRSRLSLKKHFSDPPDKSKSCFPMNFKDGYHKFKPNLCSTPVSNCSQLSFDVSESTLNGPRRFLEPLAVEEKKLDAVPEWIQQTDKFGNKFYINRRTGMTSVFSPKEVDQFTIAKRFDFVPKGLSPLFVESKTVNKSISPNSKKELYGALMENYKNELQTVKWSNFICGDTDVKEFFQKLYEEKTKQFENCIPNASRNQLPRSAVKLCRTVQAQSYPKDLLLNLDVIGQWDQKFIVTLLKTKQKLFLFDQHAVSERIRLEKLLKGYKEGGVFTSTSYKMRIENFSDEDLKILSEFKNVFQNLGIHYTIRRNIVEISRISTCLCTKHQKKESEHLKNLIISVIGEQLQIVRATRGVGSKIPQILQNVVNSEACRGAIKFGECLSLSKCEELLRELSCCQLPFQCAHGRPSLVPIITLDRDFSIKGGLPNLRKLKNNL